MEIPVTFFTVITGKLILIEIMFYFASSRHGSKRKWGSSQPSPSRTRQISVIPKRHKKRSAHVLKSPGISPTL